MTTLSGRELDEACFLAAGAEKMVRLRATPLGWVRVRNGGRWNQIGWWFNGHHVFQCPDYHASFDATYRDLWPECQRRGWMVWELGQSQKSECSAELLGDDGCVSAIGDTPAEAFARAGLAALQEVRE